MNRRILCICAAFALLALAGCRNQSQQSAPPPSLPPSGGSSVPSGGPVSGSSNEGNLLLGNPSGAATDANNFLVQKPQYTLSYNRRNGGPNWVAWHTDESDLGSVSRGQFHPDPALPSDWQILPSDYKNSGYDKGHVSPSGDRTDSRENNDATFCMSNMLPQTAALNRHVWEKLESYLREQVRAGNEVYEVAGPAGTAGTIASGAVVVPQACWKVALILPNGTNDLARINGNSRVIAVVMPNTDDKSLETADWRSYLVTPKQVEGATHLDLFAALPAQTKHALEAKIDTES